MIAAILGIYIAVEKMDMTPIATTANKLRAYTTGTHETPQDTNGSFGCGGDLCLEGREGWIRDEYGFFRLVPPEGGGIWYCIEAGGHITITDRYTYEQIEEMCQEGNELGPLTYTNHTFFSGCNGGYPDKYYHTYPYFICINDHHTQYDSYTNPETGKSQDNLYNVGYITSYKQSDDLRYDIKADGSKVLDPEAILMESSNASEEEWDGAIQHATWMSVISHNKTDPARNHPALIRQGRKLYDEAWAYMRYFEDIMNPDLYEGKNGEGFGLVDYTNADGVYTFIDQEAGTADAKKTTYTLGPFRINYVNGAKVVMYSYIDTKIDPYMIGFAGMTNCYFIDENNNTYDVSKFIITKDSKGNNTNLELKPVYFSINREGKKNENLIDRYACYYRTPEGNHPDSIPEYGGVMTGYPFPNEEFYVQFEYTGETPPKKVKIHADFQWLDCEMQICLKQGVKYYTKKTAHKHDEEHTCNCDGCCSCGDSGRHCHGHPCFRCGTWYKTSYRYEDNLWDEQQDQMEIVHSDRMQHDESIELCAGKYFDLTMQIGGFVWEDMNEYSKQGASIDGEYKEDTDSPYQGIEVILHDYDKNNNENVRRTVTDENGYYMFKNVDSNKKYYVEFVFDGQKYENTKYDNNVYTSMLGYKSNATETTNTDNIRQETNDKTTLNARDQYDARFEQIGSYPENYKVRNQLKTEIAGKLYQIGEYNKTYSWTKTEQVNGKWERVETDVAKIYDAVRKQASENAKLMESDNRTPKLVDPYTEAYKTIAGKMQSGSVEGVEGKQYTAEETASILQFLEDRRMSAYTGEDGLSNASNRYYVLKEYNGKFIIATRNEVDDKGTKNNLASTGIHKGDGKIQIGSVVYVPIYDGAYRDYSVTDYREYIDARRQPSSNEKDNEIIIPSQLRIDYGITRRIYADAALVQDLFKVTTKVNGKTQVYDYDRRRQATENAEDAIFHIEQRIREDEYYSIAKNYNRNLYKSDWLYTANLYNNENGKNPNDLDALQSLKKDTELEVYATYKITISNQGYTDMNIQEIVDYYDKDYIFEPHLSFTVYNDPRIDKDDFFNGMDKATLERVDQERRDGNWDAYYTNETKTHGNMEEEISKHTEGVLNGENGENKVAKNSSETGSTVGYTNNTYIDKYSYTGGTEGEYKSVYVSSMKNTTMVPGSKMYVYLTFRVERANDNQYRIRLDVDNAENDIGTKHNVTEINGYRTYYHDGTTLARYNGQNDASVGHSKIAGIIDTDSTPGNVTAKLPGLTEKHPINDIKGYEDDTDRAADFTLKLYAESRKLNGVVWEDERTTVSNNAMIGNGIREEGETGVKGVTVQLVELIDKGDGDYYEYIWKEVSSGGDMSGPVITTEIGSIKAPETETEDTTVENQKNGKYEFQGFITGNYIIRFKYGDTNATALSTKDGNYEAGTTNAKDINDMLGGAENETSYSGQDYKSTIYQAGADQELDEENKKGYTTSIYQNDVTTKDDSVTVYYKGTQSDLSKIYGYTDYGAAYNGNDQTNDKDITNIGQNTTGSYVYDTEIADSLEENLSDAKDIYVGTTKQYDFDKQLNRQAVIDYSDTEITNHKAEVLASAYDIPKYNDVEYSKDQMGALVDEFINNTQMRAETGIIDVEYEYNRRVSHALDEKNATIEGELNFGALAHVPSKPNVASKDKNNIKNNTNGVYVLKNIDFGLQQRSQAQLELDKRVDNVKVTLANGNVLFDASQKATNVLWLAKSENTVNRTEKRNRTLLGIITAGNLVDDEGKIQLTMDEEIMHGATIQITYKLEVENTGENDYKNTQFYYTGKLYNDNTKEALRAQYGSSMSDTQLTQAIKQESLVVTKVDELIDYINNNMEYRQVDNEYLDDENTNTATDNKHNKWEVIQKENIITDGSDYRTNENLVNVNLKDQVNEYNTIVHITDAPFLDWLKTSNDQDDNTVLYDKRQHRPVSTRTIQLLLTQTLDPESNTDKMTYANLAEIAKTSNTVGRRMAVSVVGNQNPQEDIQEVDTDVSEKVVILPPFGEDQSKIAIWSIIGVAVLALLGTGIILIKKFVIKK